MMTQSSSRFCAPKSLRQIDPNGLWRRWRGAFQMALMAGAGALALTARAQSLYLLTSDGKLATTAVATPGTVSTALTISGVTAGETLVAIDVRPQNQQLYALGVNATADTATLYHISTQTGVASVVGAAAGSIAFTTNGTTAVDLPDPATVNWDMDFNPAVDRVRVVAGSVNFRLNPNTGGPVDGDNGGAVTAGVNPDGPINGATTTVGGAAYTNNAPNNGGITTLYTLDPVSNSLFIQNPPNVGTQTAGIPVTLAGAPLDISQVSFDIAPGVNAAASNAAVAAGSGYMVAKVGGVTSLYTVNLVTGVATLLGPVGNGTVSYVSSAIRTELGAAISLNNTGNGILRFDPATPGTTTAVPVAGLTAGETLVGLDSRPQTGQLYGLGINATANTGTLYLVDPQTAAATAVGAASQIAFVTAAATPVDFQDPATVGYGFDFNPTVDRIRVVTADGLNFRLNPITGAPVDGDLGGAAGSVAGVNTDGLLNGAATSATGVAYTNNFGQTLPGTATTLYVVDAASGKLFIQNPPNAGTLTAGVALTFNGGPLTFTGLGGFDIPEGVSVAASNEAAVGEGWLALTSGATTNLGRVNLTTGAFTALGAIGTGTTPVTGLALLAAKPEITVEFPVGTQLTDNVGSVSFGSPKAGDTVTRTFTLKNHGTTPLTYSSTLTTGTVYTVSQNGTGSIPPSGSGTVTISFTPTSGGAVTDALHFVSNDTTTASFDVPLTSTVAFAQGDDKVVPGTGATPLLPLANDTLGGNVTITSVSNPAILINGRSLIIPAGFTGTSFTYDISNGTSIGRATVTVAPAAPQANALSYNGLIIASNGDIVGWASVANTTTGVATMAIRGGINPVSTTIIFPKGIETNFRFTTLGNVSLSRNTDGTLNLGIDALGGRVDGTLRPARTFVTTPTPGTYYIALASIDAAFPGGGIAIATVTSRGAISIAGRLPDGLPFTSGSRLHDDGTFSFYTTVSVGAKPPALLGGELLFTNLPTTDVTGEMMYNKLRQIPISSAIHAGGVDTILTANGNLHDRTPLFSGTGTLTLRGGNLVTPEIAPNVVVKGIPTLPGSPSDGRLRAWTVADPASGIFTARIVVPGLNSPVKGSGLYLTKSKRAWGYFPGTSIGGRIDLQVP